MKKVLSIILSVLILSVVFTGCGSTSKSDASNTDKSGKKIIKIGASPVPHKEILEKVKPILAKEGYDLQIKEFTDYVTPNTALDSGEIDANYFQHIPYLEKFNKEKHTNLVYTVKVHLEPMGVYSKKIKNLNDLKDGATIALPNDPTNESRALKVLQKAGVIKVKDSELISKTDITENKKNIKFKELDAPQLPRTLDDVDAAVINSNYALQAKLNPTKDALAIESKDSPYANVIVVRAKDKDKDFVKALDKAITSPEIKKFIQEKYNGNIIPAF